MRTSSALRVTVCCFACLLACTTPRGNAQRASQQFAVTSATFADGGMLPEGAASDGPGCGGANESPALKFLHVPRGAQSLAFVLHDLDAPGPSGFDHWVVFDVPTSVASIASATDPRSLGAKVGRNDFGRNGYAGPCPPSGPAHRYVFTVHALDVATVGLEEGATAAALRDRMRGHVLASATLEGLYGGIRP